MECPNCGFQNVPGLRACARCQSLLDFSSVSIDPPRAADVALPLSVRHAAARARASFRDAWIVSVLDVRSIFHPDVDMAALSRSIIPGWGHFHLGLKWFGVMLFGIWIGLAAATIVLMGGGSGQLAYILLVGWHGVVISLILARPLSNQPVVRRALIGLLVYGLLNLAIYLPIRWVIHGFAVPFSVDGIVNSALLRNGDTVVQTGRWTRPREFRPGEIVVYEVNAIGEPGAYIRGGTGVDRIIAGPGDLVTSDGTAIRVNGAPLRAGGASLGRMVSFRPFGVNLGHDQYFIIPSLFNIQGQQTLIFHSLLVRTCTVSDEQITGKVMFRSWPWSRFGDVNRSFENPPAGGVQP